MHYIQLKIHKFLKDVQKDGYKIPKDILEKFGNETKSALLKQFEREPREFKLSMSNVGKPLCTLQMEKAYGRSTDADILKFTFGDIVEDLVMFLIHASGIKVLAEQEHVVLRLGPYKLNGTLDVVLDIGNGPEVYDIKSASDYSFKSKKEQSFRDFIKSDVFGYTGQLFGYAKAKGYKPGGLIFCNKSSGETYVLEVPSEYTEFEKDALEKMEHNLKNINSEFKRSFSDNAEYFRNRPTGNRVLGVSCSLCDFRTRCWPEAKLLSQQASSSKTPRLLYYTHIEDNENK